MSRRCHGPRSRITKCVDEIWKESSLFPSARSWEPDVSSSIRSPSFCIFCEMLLLLNIISSLPLPVRISPDSTTTWMKRDHHVRLRDVVWWDPLNESEDLWTRVRRESLDCNLILCGMNKLITLLSSIHSIRVRFFVVAVFLRPTRMFVVYCSGRS